MNSLISDEGYRRNVQNIIDALILASTCVSFFVLSVALRTYLDDMAPKFTVFDELNISTENRKWISYASAFGTILLFTLTHTDKFQEIMEHYVSLAINSQCGLLMFIMLYNCRAKKYRRIETPTANVGNQEKQESVHYLPRSIAAMMITVFVPFFVLASISVILTF